MAALLVSGVARTDAVVDLPYDVRLRPVTEAPARASWLELPLLVLALALLTTRARDAAVGAVRPLPGRQADPGGRAAGPLLRQPIFYPIDMVVERSELAAKLMMLNPFAAIVQQACHALTAPSHPSAAEVLGDGLLLAAPIAIGLATFTLGFVVFHRSAPRIAEQR